MSIPYHYSLNALVVAAVLAAPLHAAHADEAAGVLRVRQGETLAAAYSRLIQQRHAVKRPIAAVPAHAGLNAPSATLAITSGKILSKTLNATVPPAAPVLSFDFTSPAGLDDVFFVFTSPHGQTLGANYFPLTAVDGGSVKFQDFSQTLSLYAEPGEWTLTSVTIEQSTPSLPGNTVTYDQSQLAGIFPSLTISVTNPGTPDFTPPTIKSGKLLTKLIQLHKKQHDFEADLGVTDDVSGVFSTIIFLQDPSGDSIGYYTYLPVPQLNATVLDITPFNQQYAQTGKYTITGFGASDAAGNSFVDGNETDVQALFGTTTFKVIN